LLQVGKQHQHNRFIGIYRYNGDFNIVHALDKRMKSTSKRATHAVTYITRAYPLPLTLSYHTRFITVSTETHSKCYEDHNHIAVVSWW
jgi:hypothetical protein